MDLILTVIEGASEKIIAQGKDVEGSSHHLF
jgi:hypothetical protein